MLASSGPPLKPARHSRTAISFPPQNSCRSLRSTGKLRKASVRFGISACFRRLSHVLAKEQTWLGCSPRNSTHSPGFDVATSQPDLHHLVTSAMKDDTYSTTHWVLARSPTNTSLFSSENSGNQRWSLRRSAKGFSQRQSGNLLLRTVSSHLKCY